MHYDVMPIVFKKGEIYNEKKLIMFSAVCISMGLLTGCGNTEKSKSIGDTQSTEDTVSDVIMYEYKNIRITYLGKEDSFF